MRTGKAEDLTGKIFGSLKAIKHIGSVRQSQRTRFQPALWLCRCKCGYPVAKTSDQLKKGRAFKCYLCKRRKKVESKTQCTVSKTHNGIVTYLEASTKSFTRLKSSMPCSVAKDLVIHFQEQLLPGEFNIKQVES